MKRIEIYTSRMKFVFILLGSLGFVAIGGWLFVGSNELDSQIMSIISIVFFGFTAVISIIKISFARVELSIDSSGIIITPRKSIRQFIAWDEISSFEKISIRGTKIIIIQLKTPNQRIEKEKNSFKKKWMKLSINMYGCPYAITAANLKISFQDLLALLNQYLTESRMLMK